MRLFTLRMIPMVFVGFAGLCQAAAVNGSFELGNYLPPGNDTMTLVPGSTDITGWTVHTDRIAWIGPDNPWLLSASDGDFFLDLTDYSTGAPFGGLSQEVVTRAGHTYEVTFDLGGSDRWGRPSALQVSAGSASQTFTNTTTEGISEWDSFSMRFTADGDMTTLSFVGVTGHQYIGLDNVAVNPVPVPGAVWLFGSALGLLLGYKRRIA
jgi:hypothetical protein